MQQRQLVNIILRLTVKTFQYKTKQNLPSNVDGNVQYLLRVHICTKFISLSPKQIMRADVCISPNAFCTHRVRC